MGQPTPPKYRSSAPSGFKELGGGKLERLYDWSDKPIKGEKGSSVVMSTESYDAGDGRGKKGGPTAKELSKTIAPKFDADQDMSDVSPETVKRAKDSAKEDEAYNKASSTEYKKGGSVRGWGKARGGRSAKVY
tara:strand:- start:826 stop:1224 length:399 start_codon:yes stop_codon:yes gene_type:complete